MNNELVRMLKEIIRQFGQDTLYDGKRTVGLFADLAPECSRELNMLSYLVKCNGHKMLLDVRTSASGALLVTRQKIITKMTQEYLLDAAIASTICDSFWVAIGGKPMPRTEAVPEQMHSKTNVSAVPATQAAPAQATVSPKKAESGSTVRVLPIVALSLLLTAILAVGGYALANRGTLVTTSPSGSAVLPETFVPMTDVEKQLMSWIDRCNVAYLTEADLEGMSKENCLLARNAIFAKSGRKFEMPMLVEFFSQFDWYVPTIAPADFNNGLLNSYQLHNADVILNYEAKCGYR